ncbi:MAG TPA: hypothetical protein VGK29_11745 [Paludibaculum sp.]
MSKKHHYHHPHVHTPPQPPPTVIQLERAFHGHTIEVAEPDQPAFQKLRDELFCSIRPQSALEDEIFSHLLAAAWQLRRFTQWEDELLRTGDNPFLTPESEARLQRFYRLKAAQTRAFQTALTELRRLQTGRLAASQSTDLIQARLAAHAPVATITNIAIPTPNKLATNFFRPPAPAPAAPPEPLIQTAAG